MPTQLQSEYYRSPEEYLAAERVSEQRHEYLAGVVYAMAGASARHNLLAGNIHSQLLQQLRGKPGEVYSSDLKTRIRKNAAEFNYYPDIVVDCTPPPETSFYSEEPRVIFEVLSGETERIDRGEKLQNYQALPSLSAYVLVDQSRMAVTIYRRTGEAWEMELFTGKEEVLALPEIDCRLSLREIYERMSWSARMSSHLKPRRAREG